MKKTILLLLGSFFLLTHNCFAEEIDPTEINIDNLSVSLGETDIADEFWDNGADFEVEKDNSIKSIMITGDRINTYHNIHVGDSINKVRSKYLYETDGPDTVEVILCGDQELDPEAIRGIDKSEYLNDNSRAVLIEYDYENGKVSQILISQADERISLTLDQVYVDGTVLTYNEPVPDSLKKYTVLKHLDEDLLKEAPIVIVINEENVVRSITIQESAVRTYDGIRIGMPIDNVKEKYKKSIEWDNLVSLYYRDDDVNDLLSCRQTALSGCL